MAKTIDVDSWPPNPGGDGNRRKLGEWGKASPSIVVAAALAGVLVVLFAVMALTGRLGVAKIDSREVGVVVNYMTGTQTTVVTPGYRFYIPFIQEVYILDKSQQKFVMEGAKYKHSNHVPKLSVRASDGSSFYFEEMPIQYQIRPEMAEEVLNDSGPGDAFKQEWVKAYARSILRDEFGRFTAVNAANPTVFSEAGNEALRRMNELLGPHGIDVVLIGTPNPKFDPAYEQAIEDRKSADQEVERLEATRQQLVEERDRKLAGVEREKSVEMKKLTGDLKRILLESERDKIQVENSALAYATERRLAGEGERAQLTEGARGMVAKYTKEAEGIASQAAALEKQGEVVVREAIIEKLARIRFTLVPYSRDPSPKRLEHQDSRAAVTHIDEDSWGGSQ